MSIEAYPLQWPEGWKRKRHWERDHSKFRSTFAVARDEMLREIERLRGRYSRNTDPILSTNVSLRNDGLPYANQREPEDPGVAVYFEYKEQQMCFACDKYRKVWENMVGIRKTIEAIRGIERWGASDMMERAFTGFVQLPAPDGDNWWDVLELGNDRRLERVEEHYRLLARDAHPDRGGTDEAMFRLNRARRQAREELTQ